MWVREFDKTSTWGVTNGLRALVSSAIHLGMLGYPWVLPDMVGGDAYNASGTPADGGDFWHGSRPERELYCRWCAANALLPAVQFSIAPWEYDGAVESACRAMLELRAAHMPTLLRLAADAARTREPIVRPIWWRDPHDAVALAIADEFLLGDALLVAPVLYRGATARDVYLPRGRWRDARGGSIHAGPVWVRGYKAELDELPLFKLDESYPQ